VYVVVGCLVMAVARVFWRVQRGGPSTLMFSRDNSHLFPDRTRHEPIELLWSFACKGFTTNPRNSGGMVRPGNYQALKYVVPQSI
jgi:hypothetical protein